jgi:hypothetical protein
MRLQRARLDGVLPRAKVLPKQLRKDAAHACKTNYADKSIDADGTGAK